MQLNLAQALMCRSDLLLLLGRGDQPSRSRRRAVAGTMAAHLSGHLVADSHDRGMCWTTWSITSSHRPATYHALRGSYAAFEDQQARRSSLTAGGLRRLTAEIAHLEASSPAFRAEGHQGQTSPEPHQALERMERIAAARVDSPFTFSFAETGTLAQSVAGGLESRRRLRRAQDTGQGESGHGGSRDLVGPARPERRRQID